MSNKTLVEKLTEIASAALVETLSEMANESIKHLKNKTSKGRKDGSSRKVTPRSTKGGKSTKTS